MSSITERIAHALATTFAFVVGGCSNGGGSHDASPPDAGVEPGDAAQDVAMDAEPPPPPDCELLGLETVASGLEDPIFLTAPRGDKTRLFVIEETGRVRIIKNGMLLAKPFLDVTGAVTKGFELGLLGVALHPDYANNGRFWTLSVDTKGDVVIAEYGRSTADPEVAGATPKREVMRFTPSPQHHIGGQIEFGPDGYLYAGIGDAWSGQILSSKHGKMLRIDVEDPSKPPPGNMTGSGVDPLLWSYGFHNPWRFSFDRKTGELYISDVAAEPPLEEVNVQAPGKGGTNYGFDVMSGSECVVPGCDKSGLELPVKEYDHANGSCAIMGGYVYRGSKVSCLSGKYVYTDFCSRRTFTLAYRSGRVVHEQRLTFDKPIPMSPVSFGEDSDGELYVVSLLGTVWRIVPGK